MISAHLPLDEEKRLATLKDLDLLDTLAEPEFDELVTLAAALCGTPISLVSLVDKDRQWFKAAVGLEIAETPREVAFCAHAILQESLFTVENAAADKRFSDNPLVTEGPNIRFYAGVPVLGPNGMPLGTLCVLDRVPRKLDSGQVSALEILGRQVNARLELRAERKALQLALAEKDATVLELEHTKLQLEQANQRLEKLATTDPLTGLRNRRVFDERLNEEFLIGRRGMKKLSVAMLDIDNFKQRNDRFGHPAGDTALKALAAVLSRTVRQTDIVARYGGEEFAVLLPMTSLDQAILLTERILARVRSAEWADQALTVSIGVAELDLAKDPDQAALVSRADLALYEAKRAGKDQLKASISI